MSVEIRYYRYDLFSSLVIPEKRFILGYEKRLSNLFSTLHFVVKN